MSKTGRARAALLTALILAGPACDRTSTTTPTTPVTGHVNESFTGRIGPGEGVFYSFTAPQAGAVSLTLLSVRVGNDEVGDQLIMGIGNPVGTGCNLQNSIVTGAGTAAQLSGNVSAGVYCARIADGGTLTEPVSFAVNIARPQ